MSFSLTASHMGAAKASEYLARDQSSTPSASLARARQRLETRGGFTLPNADALG